MLNSTMLLSLSRHLQHLSTLSQRHQAAVSWQIGSDWAKKLPRMDWAASDDVCFTLKGLSVYVGGRGFTEEALV